VYINLVKNVKEAFEACELVRIDCKGLNKNDCRKIGAKLKVCRAFSIYFNHCFSWLIAFKLGVTGSSSVCPNFI